MMAGTLTETDAVSDFRYYDTVLRLNVEQLLLRHS